MTGSSGGFLLTLIVLLLFRRLGARRLGSRLIMSMLALLFGSMVCDGLNSTLAALQVPDRRRDGASSRLCAPGQTCKKGYNTWRTS